MMHPAILPFSYESNTELYELLSIGLPSQLTGLPNLNYFDLDENLIHTIDSKYHIISDKNNTKYESNRFSFFHVNIRSLRSRATVSLFHKFTSLTQGDEKNSTR